ncbi:hypothetical protein [Weissella cibaria]|nr:hypothetical protein [Weissella cibaria]MBU7545430.1 hypothetical protein [Weissella cibaria]
MKNIKSIVLDRYADTTRYEYVEPGIYKTPNIQKKTFLIDFWFMSVTL